ncbi:tetratricopeptide repeat protein [Streptomyces sp. N2-109]|uniref:Tetratricopeptide repeat protein n=1 Tax=Streptomyces gossypii TaxID=2883101 RepID=A0ABT2K3L1_9ACTN|nr:tetratricopeptide repeat protein [Streptomyces gossypii]MCT2594767.1 tetratricopeptide repeat protein [Streptomyces gossypii]
MAGTARPSMQELIRRRRGSGFVGRRAEQSAYRDNLATAPGDPEHRFLFHVHGAAGVGKTSLVRLFEQGARGQGALTAYVDDSAHGVLEAMEEISAQCAQQGHALKDFDKLLSRYRQQRHEADSAAGGDGEGPAGEAGGTPAQAPTASASSTAVARTGLAGLELLPVIGTFAARAADPDQLAQGMDRWRAALSTRLRSAEDVQLVLAPLRVLTPVFLRGLADAADRVPWVALFFDTYERTGPLLDGWLREVMFGDRYGAMPANVVVTLAGQPQLDPACWGDCADLVADLPLELFTEAEARQLLAGKGITDERVIAVILQLSGRLPVLTSMLAETRPSSTEDVGDPSGTAVERFLKWITDPVRRAAALAGALPLELDEDVFRAVADEAAADLYGWLRALPFVQDASGRCRYHDVVRTAMLRVQRNQSPQRWRELHTALAEFHAARRAETEAPLEAGDFWDDEQWRTRRRAETYHLLCADPKGALPEALRDAVWCLDGPPAALRLWAETMVGAGTDTSSEPVASWGRQLLDALTSPEGEADADDSAYRARLRVGRLLLARAPLDTDTRSLALLLCGAARRECGDPHSSLKDLERARELTPDRGRVHWELGDTYEVLDRLEEAVAAYSRVLERVDQTTHPRRAAGLLDSRGVVFHRLGRDEEAVADLSRSLLLHPDDFWTLGMRARSLVELERYDEALADIERARALEPASGWLLLIRADVHDTMGRDQQEVLDDYEAALLVDPTNVWILPDRGRFHRGARRYEEALSDFDRALDAAPDNSVTWASRGETYRLLERFDEALRDFDESVRLSPGSAYALGSRAQVYRALGRYGEAEADLTAALARSPEAGWLLQESAWVHALTGRLPEALTFSDRDVALHPEDPTAYEQRAHVHLALDHFAEALTDGERALRLAPENASALHAVARVHQHTGRLDDALARWNEALARDPRDDVAWAGRAAAHLLRREPERASADFDEAVALDGAYANHLRERAWCHRLAGRYGPAREDLDRARSLAGTKASALADVECEAALLESATHGLPRARPHWERLAAYPVLPIGGSGTDRIAMRFLVRTALADWPAADTLLAELTAAEPYWLLRVEVLYELRLLARAAGPGPHHREALAARLAARWPDADIGLPEP